ncbi:hypothetical protein MMC07_003773 [Pseudocyphellaria aurata]|nr:hypothetical protein [Pseudocyphellaria aurata]
MAYTDDAVKAKLSALNETQESIVTVAQWVMFHRRHADRTGAIWLQKLKEAGGSKRLNLIYLANEVAQQSKARKKDDFLIAFSPIIAEASATAYKGATSEVQQKLRRVIEVWRQRQIFEIPIQEAVEARIDDLDKSGSAGKKPLLGGSLFSSSSGPSAPTEIQPLVPLQISVSKAVASANSAAATADVEYEKLTDPSKTIPTPPVHAARLSALLKSLASAEGAVSESIKARRALLDGLEKIVGMNRTALVAEEAQHVEFSSRKGLIEVKKREVEDGIMRGLSAESSPAAPHATLTPDSKVHINGKGTPRSHDASSPQIERPHVQELTPPPVESLTPVGSPRAEARQPYSTTGSTLVHTQQSANHLHPESMPVAPLPPAVTPGSDLLSSLSMPPVRHYASSPGAENAYKRRRLEPDFSGFGAGEDAMADLDDDVAELLRAESGGY